MGRDGGLCSSLGLCRHGKMGRPIVTAEWDGELGLPLNLGESHLAGRHSPFGNIDTMVGGLVPTVHFGYHPSGEGRAACHLSVGWKSRLPK